MFHPQRNWKSSVRSRLTRLASWFHPQRNWKMKSYNFFAILSVFCFILKGIERILSRYMIVEDPRRTRFILKGIESPLPRLQALPTSVVSSSKELKGAPTASATITTYTTFHPQRNWKSLPIELKFPYHLCFILKGIESTVLKGLPSLVVPWKFHPQRNWKSLPASDWIIKMMAVSSSKELKVP